jgi:hypothetical protein
MPNPEYGLSYYYQWWWDFCEIDDISDGFCPQAIAVTGHENKYPECLRQFIKSPLLRSKCYTDSKN